MYITKELIQKTEIVSTVLQTAKGNDLSCVLQNVRGNTWDFLLPDSAEAVDSAEFLRIQKKDCVISIPVVIVDSGAGFVVLALEPVPELQTITEEFLSFEKVNNDFNRRKDERFVISRDNVSEFGLSGLEQKLFLPSCRIEQPCAVVDVSLHGIRFLTRFNPAFRDSDSFILRLEFSGPQEVAFLKVHKVFCKLKTGNTGESVFATVSGQILEPVSLVWQDRILQFIDNLALKKTIL